MARAGSDHSLHLHGKPTHQLLLPPPQEAFRHGRLYVNVYSSGPDNWLANPLSAQREVSTPLAFLHHYVTSDVLTVPGCEDDYTNTWLAPPSCPEDEMVGLRKPKVEEAK
jgi:hypothetical protein